MTTGGKVSIWNRHMNQMLCHCNDRYLRMQACCHLVDMKLHWQLAQQHAVLLWRNSPCTPLLTDYDSLFCSPSALPLPSSSPLTLPCCILLTMIAFTMSFLLCFSARMALARDTLAWAITSSMSLCSRPPSSTWCRETEGQTEAKKSLPQNRRWSETVWVPLLPPLHSPPWWWEQVVQVEPREKRSQEPWISLQLLCEPVETSLQSGEERRGIRIY